MFRNLKFVIVLLLLLAIRLYFYFLAPKPFENGDKIRISATIRSEPVRYETSRYINLYGLKVYLPLYPEFSYGDRIVVEGTVHDDRLKNPKLIALEPARGLIYRFRNKLLDFYISSLPLPYAGLISGVTIGSKAGIPRDFWDKLKNSGTAHVVVASGMNISLVGGFLISIFTVVTKRKKALVFALLGIWSYAILSGFEAPIVRSAIMGSIGFTAQELGRLSTSFRALLLSAFIMLFARPSFVRDIGFLLSFFATLGLILFEHPIKKRFGFVPGLLREDFSTTVSAQIGVFPILLFVFGGFNFLSPLINVLVLWTIVPITVLGLLGGLVGMIVPVVGRGILLSTLPLAWWFVQVVNVFG